MPCTWFSSQHINIIFGTPGTTGDNLIRNQPKGASLTTFLGDEMIAGHPKQPLIYWF